MAEAPKFARFVRSVEGRAVARFGSGSATRACELIGAVRQDREIVWDTQRVVPLTEDYCRRYVRELNQAIRRGDLVEVTDKDYAAYLAAGSATVKRAPAKGAESEDR